MKPKLDGGVQAKSFATFAVTLIVWTQKRAAAKDAAMKLCGRRSQSDNQNAENDKVPKTDECDNVVRIL